MTAPNEMSHLGTDLLTFTFEGPNRVDEDRPLFIDAEQPARSLNLRQTRTLVRKLIAGFKAAGLKRGERVLVDLPNSYLYSVIYFAIIGAGGVYIGTNPANHFFELNHIIELAQPKFLVVPPETLSTVSQVATNQRVGLDRIFILQTASFSISGSDDLPPCLPQSCGSSEVDPKEPRQVGELLQHGESDWIRFSDVATAKGTPAVMFSTSGTSGLPKAAVSSHYAMVWQHLSIAPDPPYQIARLLSLPFFHVFAALFTHVLPIRNGQPLYILPRFKLDQYVHAIQQFGITDTLMAPPMVHALNRCPLPLADMMKTIRYIGVGGAPIDSQAMGQFASYLHPTTTLTQVWGMTEIGAAMLLQYPEQDMTGSIGRPLPGYTMKLVHAFGGDILEDHQPGELLVRYAGMMTGYKDRPPHPEGDWYATGDIMSRQNGLYYVVGRSKELIKVNGWQVAPAELEAVIMLHPCVADAAVIGCLRYNANGDAAEVPRAYVVRRKSPNGRTCTHTLSAQEVYDFSRARLASYKALEGGVVFVDDLPRTASGKIQRFVLSQMDQYRRSITELLMRNDSVIAEGRVDDVQMLKERAAESREGERRSTRRRRNPRLAATKARVASSRLEKPRRRRWTSYEGKLKALEEQSRAFGLE